MAAEVGLLVNFAQLEKCVPIRLYRHDSGVMVDWCYVGDRPCAEPFFQNTVHNLLQHPFRAMFRHQTPIEFLEQWHSTHPGLMPAGFIFHMSHCGSTLVAQMLSLLPRNIVVSEPDPLEMILHQSIVAPQVPKEQQVQWLRWMVSALGQPRTGSEKHYFIKLDAFAVTRLDVVLCAFPDVPWVFVYRNPVEVLAPVLMQIPGVAIRGFTDPAFLGMDLASVMSMPQDEYVAHLLAAYCASALRCLVGGRGMLLNFRELPGAVWTSLAGHFGIEFSPAEIAQMQQRARFDAKTDQKQFTDDSERKRRQASARLHELAAKWLDPLYERLEAARRSVTRA